MDTTEIDNKLHIFSIDEKDAIRIEEQRHEALLQKQLLEYGIELCFACIIPHGQRNTGL